MLLAPLARGAPLQARHRAAKNAGSAPQLQRAPPRSRRRRPRAGQRAAAEGTAAATTEEGAPPADAHADEVAGIFDAPGLLPSRLERAARAGLAARLAAAARAAAARLVPALESAELARRLAVTAGALALVRVGHHVLVPGVAAAAAAGASAQGLFGALAARELPGNVYALGIGPLMSAYFLLALAQALPEARRHLAALRELGRPGRDTYNCYVACLFLLFAAAQAWGEAGRLALADGGAAARGAAAATLVAAAAVVAHATRAVDAAGLGDGAGLAIGAAVAVGYADFLGPVAAHLRAHPPPLPAAAAAAGIVAALLAALAWAQAAELRLPLAFFQSRRGPGAAPHPALARVAAARAARAARAGAAPPPAGYAAAVAAAARLPLRLSPGGARTLLFANFWVSMLAAPLRGLGLAAAADALSAPAGFAALVFALEAISVGDATPGQLADFLSGSDMGVRGLSPGADTAAFLGRRRAQLKLLNAAFVAGVSLAARGADAACAALLGAPLGCLQLLLLASTALAAFRQVEALARAPAAERAADADLDALRAAGALPARVASFG
jgi:preprotein translocase subunit SecY